MCSLTLEEQDHLRASEFWSNDNVEGDLRESAYVVVPEGSDEEEWPEDDKLQPLVDSDGEEIDSEDYSYGGIHSDLGR